jgi:VWFA-related protein
MKPRQLFFTVMAIALFCAGLHSQDKTDEVIKIDTALVNLPVIVSDRDNRYIPGLTVDNFKVFQDGKQQKIEVFSNDQAPMNIFLALDTSQSTRDVLGKIKKAAKEFIKGLDSDDRCMVVTFDYQVNFLSELTADRKQLEEAINRASIGTFVGTLLQDAVYMTVRNKLRSVKGRKAVILLTDGKDHGSLIGRSELYDQLNESDTVIYPVFYETENIRLQRNGGMMRFPDGGGRIPGGIGRGGGMGRFPGRFPRDPFPNDRFPRNGRNFPGGNRPNVEAQNRVAMAFLEHLAEITGGRFFKEKKADLRNAFRQIADEMKRQYLLAFYPIEDSPAGTVHKVRVQVDRSGAVVRSKGAYRTQAR